MDSSLETGATNEAHLAHPGVVRNRWKLVMVLLVRDEEDILEAVLKFHLTQGVDYFYVIDNASTDSTPEILSRFAEQGILESRRIGETNFDQARWMSEATEYAARKLGARWVIPSDADEFWISECGDLKRSLAASDSGEVDAFRVRRLNRVAEASNPPGSEFCPAHYPYLVTGATRGAHDPAARPWILNPLPGKVIVKSDRCRQLGMGNHRLAKADASVRDLPDVAIHHFPIRSWEQFSRKVRQGGSALERSAHPPLIGRHWRRWRALQVADSLHEEYASQLLRSEMIASPDIGASVVRVGDPTQPAPRGAGMLDADEHHWDRCYEMRPSCQDEYAIMADLLLTHLDFQSAIDFGCRNGFLLDRLEQAGKKVVGIEGSESGVRAARELLSSPVLRRDLRLPIHEGRFDLVVCTEVAERLPGEYVDILLDNLVRAAPEFLFWTADMPEQTGGKQPINLQEHEYWFDRLRHRGYDVHWPLTNSLRDELERSTRQMGRFVENGTILERVK